VQPTPGTGAPTDFGGALQTLRAPGSGAPAGVPGRPTELFPDSGKVWLSVRDVDAVPIETARRGGPWVCAGGACSVANGDPGRSRVGDGMLRSIKLSTSTLPLPLTLWGRIDGKGGKVLDFDPVLLTRRSYRHVCAYKPTEGPAPDPKLAPQKPDKVMICRDGPEEPAGPDAGEILLGLSWPRQSELADFRYLAIIDSCGNARVQSFQRNFTVPVLEVASGGCGQPDGKVLRVFPQGGWIRVTAFNLEAPASGNVMNATYRVTVPPLENLVESSPARLLFPDPGPLDLQVDCGASRSTILPSPQGIPGPRPGPTFLEQEPPPADKPAGDKPAGDKPPSLPPARPMPRKVDLTGPGPQPLLNGAVVIAPEPLRQGNCRVRLTGQVRNRLMAPLALHVSLTRTDRTVNGAPAELIADGKWIVTPRSPEFQIPALSEGFDGDSRLRLVVSSDPLSQNGKVTLLSDAGRVATALRSNDRGDPALARRMIGSVVIHSAPLCGATNFESADNVKSCFRAYITIPAILAMLQVTRAPWVEKPLITRNVFTAVGAALAMDAYHPVDRKAFPIAAQVGGMFENLGDGRLGILGYVGIAPTIPVLGQGGNTTSIGLLGGAGVVYVINEKGPDEGLKPTAFLSVLVSVGQASPWVRTQ
jgi:hypothetical protein